MGKIQEQENWVPYELNPKGLERRFFVCEQLLQRQNQKGFLHRIVTATKNKSTTIISSAENHGECPDMPPCRGPDRKFTVPRLCSEFCGSSSVWCIISCWNQVKPSQGISIAPDVAPFDYHLFRSMAHGLAHQHFRSVEEVKQWIDSWIASKVFLFFSKWYPTIARKVEKVVASDGQCIES